MRVPELAIVNHNMRFRYLLHIAILLIIIEFLITIALLSSNQKYQSQNRALIIQNDSIMSVNIELTRKNARSTSPVSSQNVRISQALTALE